jgi:hypothetical protein
MKTVTAPTAIYIGIWIDHKKAVICTLADGISTVRYIASGAESHVRLAGGSWPSVRAIVSESRKENKLHGHLAAYYHKVMQAVRGAHGIFLFGPGPAKLELEREIRKNKGLVGKLLKTETTDKLTENQIKEKTREWFEVHPDAVPSVTVNPS